MSTPSPEAIEAAAIEFAAVADPLGSWRMASPGYKEIYRDRACRIIAAAAPHMEAQALREAADAAFKDKSIPGLQRTLIGTWLRARAATIEGKSE